MSVDNDEQKTQDESIESDVSLEQLAEAGADAAESSTQDGAEDEIVAIDAADLAGTQPEKTEEDKQHDNIYAANRVKAKRIAVLEEQLESKVIPESHAFKPADVAEKPKLDDYVNEDVLYSKYNGSEALALAAFNEAKDDWAEGKGSVTESQAAHNEAFHAQTAQMLEQEKAFEAKTDEYRKTVKGIDVSLDSAEEFLGPKDFLHVREMIGENAPLVLAVLGSNPSEQQAYINALHTGNINNVVKHLARLEDKVLSNLPSAKTISKAASESPVQGSGTVDKGLEAKIEKASKAGDATEYRRLMNIKRGRTAA